MTDTTEAGVAERLSVLTFKPYIKKAEVRIQNFFFLIRFFSFDAMTKQTPYRNSADAKDIIRNTDDFCKSEKEDELKISRNQVRYH